MNKILWWSVENWLDKINTHTSRILLLSTSHNKKQGIKKSYVIFSTFSDKYRICVTLHTFLNK